MIFGFLWGTNAIEVLEHGRQSIDEIVAVRCLNLIRKIVNLSNTYYKVVFEWKDLKLVDFKFIIYVWVKN